MSVTAFAERVAQNFAANIQNDFSTASGITGFSVNTVLNASGIWIQNMAHGTPGGRFYDIVRMAQTTAVDFATEGSTGPDSAGEMAGLAAGLVGGLVAGAMLGPGWAAGIGAVAVGMVAGWFAEALTDTLNEQYPNLGADFQNWLNGLKSDIENAASDAWATAQAGWDNATGAVADWWQNLDWGDINGNGVPDWMNFPEPGTIYVDPLVIDLNGNGVELIGSSQSNAFFDYAGDGFREKTGWAAGGDGMLVRDLNGNGLIESMSELLTSPTQNAFQVLKTLDINNDNKMNASDSAWSSLRVWVDADGDGITDAGELKSLGSLGLTEINLASTSTSLWKDGNRVEAIGTVTINGVLQAAQAVFFGTQSNNAVFTVPTGFVPHADVRLLPNFSGGGGVAPLHYSMSLFADLRASVKTLVETSATKTFAQLRSSVEAIILQWSNADDAVPGSRGANIDAKHLAAVEAFGGAATTITIDNRAAALLESQYQQMIDDFTIRFAVQSFTSAISLAARLNPAPTSLPHNFSYLSAIGFDASTNALSINVQSFALDVLEGLKANGADALSTLKSGTLTPAIVQSLAVLNLLIDQSAYEHAISTGFYKQDIFSSLTDADFSALKVVHYLMAGGSLADVVIGTSGSDILTLDTADAIAVGGLGNDAIIGNSGKNLVFGETGNDTLTGLAGDDTYIYNNGDGVDTIVENGFNQGTADALVFTGHTFAQLKVARSSTNNDLILTFTNSADQVVIKDGALVGYSEGIEKFNFTGGVVKTIAELRALSIAQKQTTGADTIKGFISWNDTFTGGVGNDTLTGLSGNDTYIYNNGDGVDTIVENGFNEGAADALTFTGHSFAQLKVARSATNNDLLLTFTNNADQVVIKDGALVGYSEGIESFGFTSGVTKTIAELRVLSITQKQTTGADTIKGFITWNDTFTGGTGNDTLTGLSGNDTYVYNNGDGIDTIVENGFNEGTADTLTFTGHSFSQLKVARSATNNDLILTFTNNTDQVVIKDGALVGYSEGIESFGFTSGITKTIAELRALSITQKQTTGADTLKGFISWNDAFTGGAGNDTISGYTGNDTFNFATGFGKDIITDFTAGIGAGDVLRLSLGTNFNTYAKVFAASSQVGANTVVTIDANTTITLNGVTKTNLVADDFAFY